jgi:hypothetical protein
MVYLNLSAFDDLVSFTYKDAKVFLIDNFFHKDCMDEIKLHLDQYKDHPLYWTELHLQEEYQRKKMVIDEIPLFNNILQEMSDPIFINKLNQTLGWNVKNGSFSIWHDTEGYNIGLHVDNDRVKNAIQVYLKDVDITLGTSFAKKHNGGPNDVFLTIPYKENFGYCMKNVDSIEHGLINKVPNNFNRYSIYCLFE